MQLSRKLLKDYARLIVRTGANVQPGQIVQLTIAVDQHEFAALITEECYLAGAKKVNVDWYSDMQSRLNFQYADRETLSRVLPWEEEKARQMNESRPKTGKTATNDTLDTLGRQLSKSLGVPVKLKNTAKGSGSINRSFKNEDELARLMQLFDRLKK